MKKKGASKKQKRFFEKGFRITSLFEQLPEIHLQKEEIGNPGKPVSRKDLRSGRRPAIETESKNGVKSDSKQEKSVNTDKSDTADLRPDREDRVENDMDESKPNEAAVNGNGVAADHAPISEVEIPPAKESGESNGIPDTSPKAVSEVIPVPTGELDFPGERPDAAGADLEHELEVENEKQLPDVQPEKDEPEAKGGKNGVAAKEVDIEEILELVDLEENKPAKQEFLEESEELWRFDEEPKPRESKVLTKKDLRGVKSVGELLEKLDEKKLSNKRIRKLLNRNRRNKKNRKTLEALQTELIKLQRWVASTGKRVAILFDGPDLFGNERAIRRFTEYLDPHEASLVAPQPSTNGEGEIYFQHYLNHLPGPGKIAFFDRSWYDRAILEPLYGMCSGDQYESFLRYAPEFENMLRDENIHVIKLWFSVSRKELKKRLKKRKKKPFAITGIGKTEKKIVKKWAEHKHYRELMFSRTHTAKNPWITVDSSDQATAEIESIRYVVSSFEYEGKDEAKVTLIPDPEIVSHCHRPELNEIVKSAA